jgi:hypothetical protein
MLQTHIESKNGLQSFIEASPEEELSPLGIASIQDQMKKMADFGRNGDIYVVHAAEGETVIPLEVLNANPKVRDLLFTQMTEMGLDPERYVVGNELNSLNPVTGAPEFFFSRIFKSVKKRLKKLRGTGVFTTLMPLLGQQIGFPGGPKFLRPGTAGANVLWGMLGEWAEQGSNFDPKKAAKRLALNLVKGVALKGGMNILTGEDTLEGIDSSYFTGEGYESTAEKFGFGDKAAGAREITSNIRENLPKVQRDAPKIETRPIHSGYYSAYTQQPPSSRGEDILVGSEGGDKLGLEQPYTIQQHRPGSRLPTTDPDAAYQQKLAKLRLNAAARAKARKSVDDRPWLKDQEPSTQREALKAKLFAKMTPKQRREFELEERRSMAAKYLYGNNPKLMERYLETQARRYEEANKRGLFGFKGPLGLPSLAGTIHEDWASEHPGLANLIDLGLYGTAGYLGAKEAGWLDEYDDDRDQPTKKDLAGFVPSETGADLLAADPEKYKLPEEALDPSLFTPEEAVFANKGGMVQKMATGGFPRRQLLIEGQGTGTSDEIPAMLSDGEFVMTNKSVEGADPSGNGDRYAGARNLYGIMRDFEMRA